MHEKRWIYIQTYICICNKCILWVACSWASILWIFYRYFVPYWSWEKLCWDSCTVVEWGATTPRMWWLLGWWLVARQSLHIGLCNRSTEVFLLDLWAGGRKPAWINQFPMTNAENVVATRSIVTPHMTMQPFHRSFSPLSLVQWLKTCVDRSVSNDKRRNKNWGWKSPFILVIYNLLKILERPTRGDE